MTENNFDIDDIIVRYLTDETSAAENKFLSQWLNESSDNQAYFNAFKNVWLAASQITSSIPASNIGPEVKLVDLTSNKEFRENRWVTKAFINKVSRVAAILVIALLSGVIIYNRLEQKAGFLNNNSIEVEATLGSRAITTLPDGTKVWLNSGSKLQYNANFNGRTREVSLSGEAYFKVVTNPEKPFVVKTNKISIKALGTIFNVKAYPDDDAIVTTLVKGKVVIEGRDNTNKDFVVQMKPKETITYYKTSVKTMNGGRDGGTSEKSIEAKNKTTSLLQEMASITRSEEVNTVLYTSWKDNRWLIEKQKLESLSKDLERRYNIRIQFLSDTIKEFHFTGTIENETIEQIMMILRHTIPLNYKIEKGVIKIGEDIDLMNRFYNGN